jgi:hypothetical protein
MNIYAGKEPNPGEGTLGEREEKRLASTMQEKDVTLAFDRFFTPVYLMETLNFAAVGTCLKNRKKNVPRMANKLERGEAEFRGNTSGTLSVK